MSIYEKYHDSDESLFGEPIACCNIRDFWIVKSQADKEEARKEFNENEGLELVTIEEYEKISGEKFDPEEDFMVEEKVSDAIDLEPHTATFDGKF